MTLSKDLSLDLYLHSLKLHRGHIQFLEYFYEGTSHLLPKHKFITDLSKFGYIYEDKMTEKGNSLMYDLHHWSSTYEPKVKTEKKKLEYSKEFETWWEAYPALSQFEFAGKPFPGTRRLRTDKEQCSVVFEEVLKEVPLQLLLDSLEYEVTVKMDQSVTNRRNELQYMNGTLPYLNQRKFKDYVALALKGKYQPANTDHRKVVHTTVAF